MPLIQNYLAGHRVVTDISEGAAIINGDEFIFTNAVEVKPGDVVIIDGNMAQIGRRFRR